MLVLFWQKQEQTFDRCQNNLLPKYDIDDFVPFNEVYATAFTSDFPARSAVEVARLPKDVKLKSKYR